MQTRITVLVAAIALFSPLIAPKLASAMGIDGTSYSCIGTFTDSSYPYSCDYQDLPAIYTPAAMLIPTTVSSTITSPDGLSTGNITGSAGTLKAYAFNQFSAVVPEALASQSYNFVRGSDQLMITSPTLATGTSVDILFTMRVDGTLLPRSAFGNGGGSAEIDAAFYGSDGQDNNGVNLQYGTIYQPLFDPDPNTVQIHKLLTGRMTTVVGRQINLLYVLQATSTLNGRAPIQSSEVDFSHTSQFFVDAQTPGVVLTSFSGHNYASPAAIPTPALLPGLIVLGAALRRRRQKVCA
jgi:hypothetical protein